MGDQKIIHKTWGYERCIVDSSLYGGKELFFFSGKWGSLHYHREKTETFYIIAGQVRVELINLWEGYFHNMTEKEQRTEIGVLQWKACENQVTMRPGDSLTIKPYTAHRVLAMGDSRIIEFSTEHRDEDTYRLIDSNGKIVIQQS